MFYKIAANLRGQVRREIRNGRRYLVAPLTLIVPGVLHGSCGPLLYPRDELAKNTRDWDGIPLTLGHPTRNGQPVSANSPSVSRRLGLGFVAAPKFNDRLQAEGWFDVEAVKRIDQRIYDALKHGRPVELSTGLNLDVEKRQGTHDNGKRYSGIARKYRPDHVAILPDEIGACSISDGCGVLMNHSFPSSLENLKMKLRTHNAQRLTEQESQEDLALVPPTMGNLLASNGQRRATKPSPRVRHNAAALRDGLPVPPTLAWAVENEQPCNCGQPSGNQADEDLLLPPAMQF